MSSILQAIYAFSPQSRCFLFIDKARKESVKYIPVVRWPLRLFFVPGRADGELNLFPQLSRIERPLSKR